MSLQMRTIASILNNTNTTLNNTNTSLNNTNTSLNNTTQLDEMTGLLDDITLERLMLSCKNRLKSRKWTFTLIYLIDYLPYECYDKISVIADSLDEAMEKLAFMWNDADDYDEIDPYLQKILDGFEDLYDDNGIQLKISPKMLEEIIFKTGNPFYNYMPACWDGPPDWEFKIDVRIPHCMDDPEGSNRLKEYSKYDRWENKDWISCYENRT